MASNYYNFVEAKKVLQDLVKAIDIIEQLEERTLSISYAYLAVSQYYYVLLEFDKVYFLFLRYLVFYFYIKSGYLGLVLGS